MKFTARTFQRDRRRDFKSDDDNDPAGHRTFAMGSIVATAGPISTKGA